MTNLINSMAVWKGYFAALLLAGAISTQALAQPVEGMPQADLPVSAEPATDDIQAKDDIQVSDLPVESFWHGANSTTLGHILASTRLETLSPTGQQLLKRLLLSENWPMPDPLRVNRTSTLLQLGALSEIASSPVTRLTDADADKMAEFHIIAHLLDGGLETACPARAQLPPAQKPGAVWARLDAVCFELAGDSLQTELALEVSAAGGNSDPVFEGLFAALSSHSVDETVLTADKPSDAFTNALHVAMLRKAGLSPTIVGATAKQPHARLSLIRANGAPLEMRIAAAEQALTAGQILPNELGALYIMAYSGLSGDAPPRIHNPLQTAATQYNAVTHAARGKARIAALAAALQHAKARGTFMAAAHLYADTIIGETPALAEEVEAAILARALLTIGAFENAKPWFMITYEAARQNTPGAFERLSSTWPLMAMASDAIAPRGIQNLAAGWLSAQDISADEKARHRAVVLFTLLETLGHPVEEELWAQLLPTENSAPYHVVDHTVWRGMEAAAARGKNGMALAHLLMGLSQANIADHHPAFIAGAVSVLMEIGLSAEGHKLAVDALLAAGL